jgi:hypothetical protein
MREFVRYGAHIGHRGMLRAMNHGVERVFNSDRKDPKLKRDL